MSESEPLMTHRKGFKTLSKRVLGNDARKTVGGAWLYWPTRQPVYKRHDLITGFSMERGNLTRGAKGNLRVANTTSENTNTRAGGLGEEQIAALLQESLSVAHRAGAIETKDLERVVVDATVQEKAVAHPTDARLTHRAIEKLVDLAKREGVKLRQSYLRLAKRATIMVGRYTHAHQFKRARRELKFLRTRLGRIIRDIRRQIDGDPALEDRFGPLLDLALRVRHQEQRQRGPKVYSLHAPEVECIGKGKARAPYEFGCKVSIVTPVTAPKGGQFVLHAKALHGNPYDGHTLGPVIAGLERLTGVAVRRIHGDKGYRGHNYPDRFRVWISGQVRRVTKAIRREMRRRAAVEPVIGHLKDDHRMRRNYLKGRSGDRINAVLAAAGYNFSLLRSWFEDFLRALLSIFRHSWTTPLPG